MTRVIEKLERLGLVFASLSERSLLAAMLDEYMGRGAVRWLDIGVGDGSNTDYLITALRNRRSFEITSVDPEVSQDEILCREKWVWKHYQCAAEMFSPDLLQNIVNIRQSLYYFGNWQKELLRMLQFMNHEGVCAITIWNERCLGYRLHAALAKRIHKSPDAPSAEQVISVVRNSEFRLAASETWAAPVDVEALSDNTNALNALIELAQRRLKVGMLSQREQQALLENVLQENKCAATRSNTILLVVR